MVLVSSNQILMIYLYVLILNLSVHKSHKTNKTVKRPDSLPCHSRSILFPPQACGLRLSLRRDPNQYRVRCSVYGRFAPSASLHAENAYQQFINRFSTEGKSRFLHFFGRKMQILGMKLPKSQSSLCQKVAEWFCIEICCIFAAVFYLLLTKITRYEK